MKLVLLTALVVAMTSAWSNDVADIPMSACTADKAMMTAHFAALTSETSTGPAMVKAMNRFQALADKYSATAKPNQPIGELMSKDESVEFAKLSAQTLTMRLYGLAESRMQRDMGILQEMHALAIKDRDEGIDVRHMADLARSEHLEAGIHPGMNRELLIYAYLNTLKESFKNDDKPPVRATGECSVELALESENGVTYRVWQQQVESSSALKEFAVLRDKYHLAQGAPFEPSKMAAEDVQRAAFLQPQVAGLFRPLGYFGEMNGLEFFAQAAYLEYAWQKEDILELGGSANVSDYRKLDDARYAKLTPAQQRAINIWQHLDGDLPSQSMLNSQEIAKAAATQ